MEQYEMICMAFLIFLFQHLYLFFMNSYLNAQTKDIKQGKKNGISLFLMIVSIPFCQFLGFFAIVFIMVRLQLQLNKIN